MFEGCLRVGLNNSRIRISFVWNGQDIGGFSTNLDNLLSGSAGVNLNIPCVPNASLALRVKSNRRRPNGRQRFCLNALARGPLRTLLNRDLCFDINGNAITTASGR